MMPLVRGFAPSTASSPEVSPLESVTVTQQMPVFIPSLADLKESDLRWKSMSSMASMSSLEGH